MLGNKDLEKFKALRIVVRIGSGVDNIDVKVNNIGRRRQATVFSSYFFKKKSRFGKSESLSAINLVA